MSWFTRSLTRAGWSRLFGCISQSWTLVFTRRSSVILKDLMVTRGKLTSSFGAGRRHGLIGHPDPPLISEDRFILLQLVLQSCTLHVLYFVYLQHGRDPADLVII